MSYQSPSGPFKKVDNQGVDIAWQNPVNGNTIAYLSECKENSDTPLRSMASENISALSNPKILSSDEITFNDREALRTLAEGQVDGVGVQLNLVFFKKNGCDYTLSYVGRKKQFVKDQTSFDHFVESFKAP